MEAAIEILTSLTVEHLNALIALGALAVSGFAIYAIYNISRRGEQK